MMPAIQLLLPIYKQALDAAAPFLQVLRIISLRRATHREEAILIQSLKD
jgi:uncharacterized DUF497 family protein